MIEAEKKIHRKSSIANTTNQFGGLKIKEKESVFVFDQNKKSKYKMKPRVQKQIHCGSVAKYIRVLRLVFPI